MRDISLSTIRHGLPRFNKLVEKFGITLITVLSILGCVGLMLAAQAGFGLMVLRSGSAAAIAPASGTISGTVFQDFNSDGKFNTTSTLALPARDIHIAGVMVTAYDTSNNAYTDTTVRCTGAGVPKSFCTGADIGPNFEITAGGSGPYRIEFTSLPASYRSGPAGADSHTSVQFAPNGNSTDINYGVNYPVDYCQNNPRVAVPCYVTGDPLLVANANDARFSDVLVSFNYNDTCWDSTFTNALPPPTPAPTCNTSSYVGPQHDARAGEIGSVYGVAWQRSTRKLFTSAVVKRHSGLGPLGTGGIYVTDYSSGSPVTSPFIDVNTLNIDTGTISGRNLPASKADNQSNDDPAFAAAGKIGIGDMDISDDGKTLWLTNLNDRSVWSIFINDPPVTPTTSDVKKYSFTNTACKNGVERPWGLKFYRGKVYAGVVCSAELGGTVNDLEAIVYSLVPNSNFTEELRFPLDYTKGYASSHGVGPNQWSVWSDTFDYSKYVVATTGVSSVTRPEPILSDIEFDLDGSMILGFADRTGFQIGYNQPAPSYALPPPPNTPPYKSNLANVTGGDLLRVGKNGTIFMIENNSSPDGINFGPAMNNLQGPGGGEFYWGDSLYNLPVNNPGSHEETSLGALAFLPGSGEVLVTIIDPYRGNTNGVGHFMNNDGSNSRRYEVYPPSFFSSNNTINTAGTFGKGAGLGDIEILCDPAPIEIGNRIWNDSNGDGIQDPGEPPISGVTVNLYDPANGLLATAVTDSNGSYYFSNAAGTSTANAVYGVSGLQSGVSGYSIKLDNPNDYLSGGPLGGLSLTTADAGGNDSIDSDGNLIGGFAQTTFAAGGPGENDHTFDFGFFQSVTPPTIMCPADIMTMTTTGSAAVTYPDPVTSGAGVTVTCTPQSPFPLGATTVTCTASNAAGSVSCSFVITVKAAKCQTICFRSPQYYLLNPRRMPRGAVIIYGANYNAPVSSGNAIKQALMGNSTGTGLTPVQQFNSEFVAAQLNLLSAGGADSPMGTDALWSLISCYGLDFAPVVLSNNVTLTPGSTLNDLFAQGFLAIRENRTADMQILAILFDLLNGNKLRGCN